MEQATAAKGKVIIAPEVLTTMARLATLGVAGIARMAAVPGRHLRQLKPHSFEHEGVRIAVDDNSVRVDLYVVVTPESNMRAVSQEVQTEVARTIQELVGMEVEAVNVHIQDVAYLPE